MKWIYYIYSLLMNYLLPIHSIIYHEGIMEKNVDMTVHNEGVQSYVDDSNMNPNADEPNLSTSFIVPIMTDEQRLLSKILNGYDTASRPIFNASKSVQVGFQFTLIQISQLDEVNQVLTLNVWIEQEWIDERLTWNPQDYNNLSRIRIPCQKLWLPDIVLYNSADDYKTDYMQSKAMVQYNGNVFWPPPAKLRSTCKIDITYFPFDDQSCTMKFGSWTYDGWQVNVIKRHDEVDTSNYVENGEWDLLKVVVERHEIFYPCCNEPYPDLRFTIYMRRRTLYYLFNIIFPCLWLTVLSLVSFWLPPDSGEKITLGITVLLAFSVFMLLIAENMPATSEFVPLIGVYLTVTMTMTSLSIILTVLVLHLHHTGSNRQAIPKFIRKIFFDFIAKFLCLNIVNRYEIKRNQLLNIIKQSKLILDQIQNDQDHINDPNDLNFNSCHSNNDQNFPHFYHNLPSDNLTSSKRIEEQISSMKYTKNTNEQHSFMNEQYESMNNRLSSIIEPKTTHIVQLINKDDQQSTSKMNSDHKLITKYKQYEMSYDHRSYYTTTRSTDDLIDDINFLNKNYTTHSSIKYLTKFNKNELKFLEKKLLEILKNTEKQQKILKIYLLNLYKKQYNEQTIIDIINEWRILAIIVDRMLFWLFLFIAIIATIVILLIMPLFKPTFA
ncbi:unnamed protein product [Schistosoma rodhaini]|uniref:Neurotransmitter-gated ion-channel ligand-binding domain-containing protein n=1 Tax=Schistosoma rodhaini TaxID=6188 RepID=A0AA85GM18_9TREM|nr:unnamed protein product [Schistosoma rodhaini]